MKKTLHSFKFTKKINKAFYLLLFLLFSTIGFAQTITPTKIVTVAPGVCGALDVELKIQGSNPVARPLEVVLVIDVSGSMGDGNNPKPLSRAQDAAIDFINKMFLPANNTTNKNRVAIVTYSTTASIRRNLTLASGQADLISVINGLSANGSTNIQDGLVKAKTVLDGATYDCATARSIVLLTDGVANATGTNGASCSDGQQGTCIQSAITAATAAKTVTVSGTSYNNQIFSVGLFGAISGTEQTNAQYTLNQIQSGGSFFTENAADLTGIYGQIFTQLSWVAKQIPSTAFEKETVDSNFIIGTVTPSKGTVTIVGQQINWNIDFLNVETITLKYRLTPKPNTCGNQLVSTSRLDFQNAACVTTFQNITSPTTNVPCPIITLASQTNVTCFGVNNGAITLNTPTGGQAPYTYKWTKNNVDFATTKDLTNLSFGTYRVTATDSNGCATGILTVEITQPSAALVLAASSKTDVSCFGKSTGTVTAGVVTNSVGTVTYTWKNASNVTVGTTASVSNLPAGTYTLTVTDSCSSQTNSVTITQPSAALALAASSKTDVICFGASTGTVTAGTVSNSVGTVTYTWKNASNVAVGSTASVSNLPAGIYTLTVSDSCSSQTNSVTITQPNAALALAASSKTDVICFGASTGTVTAGVVTNSVGTVTYTWKNASNVTVGTTALVSNLPAGTYTLTVSDSCSSQTNSVTITQPNAALALAASSKTDVICFGASTGTVTAGAVTNSVGTVAYTWKNSSNTTVGTTASVSNLPAGTYTLTITDSCSSQTNSVTITQPSAALALAASSKTDVICFGASTGTVTAGVVTNSVGTVTYTWKNASNVTVGTTASVSNLPEGTYTLTVSDNCSSQSNSVTITQPSAALALSASSKTDVTCFGASTGTVTAGTVTNSVGTVTYTWKNASNVTVGTTASVSNLPAGTYTLTVTDSCSSQTNSVTITQPSAALALSASSKTDVTCYSASTGTVTAGTVTNSVGTVTYTWKNNSNTTVGTTATVSNLPAGTYTLTVTDSCSSQTNSVTITQPSAALALAASSKTDVTCFGVSTGTVTAGVVTNSVGTVTYSWTNSLNAVVGNTASVSNLPAGTYTLTVSDNCSSRSNSVTINQPSAALALSASSKIDVSCFGESTGSLTAGTVTNAVGTVIYNWTNSSNVSVGNTASVSNLPAGTYTLTVTDNCSSQSNSVTISQPGAVLTCSITQNKAVTANGLSNGEATVTPIGGNGNYTYLWDNNETTQKAVGLNAGLHTVTVTDEKGCTTTCSITITEPNVLSCSITQNSAVKCFGESNGQATVTAIGGNGDYTYLWDNNETTTQAVSLNAGLHTVTVTDKLGYTTTCTVTITQPQEALSATTTQVDVVCGGGNTGSATVFASGGTSPYTYSWNTNPAQTSATATTLAAGNYSVIVTDANLCTVTKSVTIIDGDSVKPIIDPLPETSTINCPAEPAFAQATATDNIETIASLTYEDAIVPGNCAGSYTKTRTWTATDSCGNVSLPVSQTIIVQDTTAPTWTTQAGSLNQTIECSNAEALTSAQALFPTASDLCDADVSNITKVSGQFVASEGCANAGTYTNTWTVKDDCGNTSDTFTQIITIQDTTAPTWTTQAGSLNQTIECSNAEALTSAQALFPTASDLCDIDVSNITKVSGQFTASEGCSNAGTYTNTWTVKDDCGNTSDTFTQIITIQDTTAPTWTTQAGSLNQTIECSNQEALTAAQALFPSASDLCDSDVSNITKVSGQFTASEGCANSGTYTNTWTVKDDCGNTSDTFTQVITIQDTTSPTWTTQSGSLNLTIECSNQEALTSAQALFPTASDLCDADVSNITKVSGQFVASEGCSNSGTYTNTWTVKDDCGNTSDTFTQIITIQDTTAPTWATQSGSLNQTIECSNAEALTAAQALFPTASDLCDADVSNITKVSGQFVASEGCANSGTYTNTWTVKDDCGNTSDTFTQVITIQDTTAPTWTTQSGSLNQTIECSNAEALTSAQALFPTASDLCDADVSNITKVSGQFVASEGCGNSGTYTNTWTVKDDCGNTSDTFTQIITIQDTTAPTWTTQNGSLNQTIECSNVEALATAQALFPTASDLCDLDVTNITKVSGQFVASEGCANSGTYTNTWTVKDDCGNTSNTFTQIITIQDTTAPTWTTQAGSLNQTIECSNAEALTSAQALFPTASDLCDADVSNITKVSGQFVASEGCSNAGTYTNTWTVKDNCENTSDTFTQIITIQDTTAPTWTTQTGSLDVTLQCTDTEGLNNAQTQAPIATDNCNGTVTYTKTTGELQRGSCGSTGTYTNTWTAKDSCNNTSTIFTQVITIQDTAAPTWVTQAGTLNVTLQCSDTAGLENAQNQAPTATANCTVVTYEKTSGQFVSSEGCSNAGTYTNSWIAKDDCGNVTDSFIQIITIQDTTPPAFTGNLPTDITVSCDAVPEPANIEASDNCSGNLPIVFSEIKSNVLNECGTDYTLTRKWTTSDCGGNTVSHTQIITVRDTTPPTGTAPADVTDLQSIIDIPAPNPQVIIDAADNCSSTVTITISDSNNGGSGCNGNAYILTRTYTLTDCSGNKTELVQTFTVENKVSVTGIATNVTCFGKNDGSILVTNSPGSTVVITNDQNEVIGNTNLPAGTYTLTATSAVNGENQTCTATATVVITQPEYSTKISGYVMNVNNNSGIANVMVTLIPQGTTTGPILLRITGTDGGYSFTGMSAGSYLVQVQDATLNSVYQLYPTDSSLFFTVLEDCTFQEHTFNYGSSTLPVLGDYVWYDVNSNGIQDEWYDANNDGVVTKNVPDSGGGIDYSLWEWIDFNGDGSYQGPSNVGELNAGGFGNAASPNVIIDGPNGYHKEVIIGIEGYWRDRPNTENPYGQYTIKLVKDANLDAMAAALGATGLVKVLPNLANKKATAKTGKIQMHTVCSTTSPNSYIVNVTPQDLVHLDNDFGINCKEYRDIVANDDSAGPLAGVNHTTTNVLNVLVNDTLEGNAVTVSDVIITTVTPNEFLQLNPDGSVDVLPNAPVGTLTLVYQICEADQTSNCDTATVTITIVAPVMTVTATPICVNDVPYIDYVVTPGNFIPVNGVTIAWANAQNTVITTMTNLPLSGRVLWPGAVVNEAGNGIDWPGWIFENNKWVQGADGFESLRPTVNLTISVNPSETITVNYPPADPYCIARPTFAIVANDDNPPAITAPAGVTNIVNVYNNDTLNNDPVNPADVTLTTVTPDPTNTITLNPDGSVDVAPNSLAGTYTLTYQICENADAGNCDTAIVTVIIVEPAPPTPVVANDDVYTNIGCNTFGLVGNVLSNDFKGQLPATLELVNFTLLAENENNAKTDPNITIDNQGNVTVSSLTPAGTYTYTYRICDKLSAENCDTATVTITVVPNGIVNITSESCNDDSSLINLSNLLPEGTPITGTWIDTNETNALQGNIFNPFGLALGNYIFEYKITDENCPRSVLLNMEVNNDCHVLACGNILVHNAFSPNGDGINDVFVIDSINDITCYPENTVEIYNRWGILVFETSNYNNTTNAFDGTSRGRTTVNKSDGLPSGTYFYILTYKSLNGNNEIQNNKEDGYLYLSK
ncbi:gliding motility-associated C-terminal domain-containing protein [Flavobacterium sp. UBA7680]|uniref:T9SS type B sorting domain-containing protein n=1 Tax=Flavobacterium sp. UBA7680 TaxID=1946559 RepID=UPI0025BEDF1A|nr:gliding motility-associated C-terminal domain-containing protein [Flavobacterium sp. UBA7680]